MPRPVRGNVDLLRALSILVKSHPWHGVAIGDDAPGVVTTFVELVPSDTVKYELDKATGLLKIDRPSPRPSPALLPDLQAVARSHRRAL